MALNSVFVALALFAVARAYVWPNPKLDQLESVRYDQYGYNKQIEFFDQLDPCSTPFETDDQQGRSNAADWIRNVRLSIQLVIHILTGRAGIPRHSDV
jgi:hypothetical protein